MAFKLTILCEQRRPEVHSQKALGTFPLCGSACLAGKQNQGWNSLSCMRGAWWHSVGREVKLGRRKLVSTMAQPEAQTLPGPFLSRMGPMSLRWGRRMWVLFHHHLHHHPWAPATHAPHYKPLMFNTFVPKGELRSRPETWSVQSKVRARAQVF